MFLKDRVFGAQYTWGRYSIATQPDTYSNPIVLSGQSTQYTQYGSPGDTVYAVYGFNSYIGFYSDSSSPSSMAPGIQFYLVNPTSINKCIVLSLDTASNMYNISETLFAMCTRTPGGQGPGTYIDTIASANANAYPINGAQNGYWYVKQ